jgi:hypothetical protein
MSRSGRVVEGRGGCARTVGEEENGVGGERGHGGGGQIGGVAPRGRQGPGGCPAPTEGCRWVAWRGHVAWLPQNWGEVRADRWAPATVPHFSNSNGSEIFKLFQNLTDPNLTFLRSKNLE